MKRLAVLLLMVSTLSLVSAGKGVSRLVFRFVSVSKKAEKDLGLILSHPRIRSSDASCYSFVGASDGRPSESGWVLSQDDSILPMGFMVDSFEKKRMNENLDFMISAGQAKPLLKFSSTVCFDEASVVDFEKSASMFNLTKQPPLSIQFSVRPNSASDTAVKFDLMVKAELLQSSTRLVKHNMVDSINVRKGECVAILCPFSPKELGGASESFAHEAPTEILNPESILVVVANN